MHQGLRPDERVRPVYCKWSDGNVREKIAEYQEKLKALEAQKTEAENLEIVQMVRALRLTPEQLNAMLSGGTVPGMAAASANYNEQEDTAHEE